LVSVDVFRGGTMAAMVIVNTPGDWSQVFWPFLHAEWHGWTPSDLIFPFFVFLVGVAVVLSPRSQTRVSGILRRGGLLYLVGLGLALYPRFDVATVRLMGVLPRLALCYTASALIYRSIAQRPGAAQARAALTIAGGLLALYWGLLMWVPPPGGVAGDLAPGRDLGAWIDRALLGEAHLWRTSRTWDPEGLLSTLPAVGTALTGIAAGVWLRSPEPVGWRLGRLLTAGALGVACGVLWDLSFPINKNLWTSSYVLLTSGLAMIGLAALHYVFDVRSAPRLARPWVVLGTNALVLFVASGWLVKTLTLWRVAGENGASTTAYRWIYVTVFAPLAPPKIASLAFAIAMLAVLYLALEGLYRRRWFVRV
jgi:predicted acyltransferase